MIPGQDSSDADVCVKFNGFEALVSHRGQIFTPAPGTLLLVREEHVNWDKASYLFLRRSSISPRIISMASVFWLSFMALM